MAEPDVYKIRYARHVLSESNAKDNSGVDKHDPVITTPEVEADWLDHKKLDKGKLGYGIQYAEGTMREEWSQHEKKASVFMVSPLTRVIQTFLLSVTEEELRTARIIIEPLLIEQTLWFSDRPKSVNEIQKTIEENLQYRFEGTLKLEDLDIKWGKMLESKTKKTGEPQDYYVKTGLWAPERLLDRGQAALRSILAECKKLKPYKDYDLCVFGHGGFVNYVTQEIGHIDVTCEPPKLSSWQTGEIRNYEIYDDPAMRPKIPLMVKEGAQRLVGVQAKEEDKKRDDLISYIATKTKYTQEKEAWFKKDCLHM
ncbi:hypothetical protein G7054_g11608 [Neopestalotiopsis clavispora]|nr:hypothetical protein G7054_g11608 [Neopestalotiopsis clavispora]